MFIRFEGNDASILALHLARLSGRLRGAGIKVLEVDEKRGSEGGRLIAELLDGGCEAGFSGQAAVLMMHAARNDVVERIVRPAREAGFWVLSHGFPPPTLFEAGSWSVWRMLDSNIAAGDRPDLILRLECSDDTGRTTEMSRCAHESERDTRRTSKTWAEPPLESPPRSQKIDATRSPDLVASAIWSAVLRDSVAGV